MLPKKILTAVVALVLFGCPISEATDDEANYNNYVRYMKELSLKTGIGEKDLYVLRKKDPSAFKYYAASKLGYTIYYFRYD
jgi:hypothetical protein